MVRILFIDDDADAHIVLKMVLPSDYRVISTFAGRQGIEAVRREAVDLVLLDINLPDIGGIDVLRRIASVPGAPPVVVLTACGQIGLAVQAMKQGASDFLTKPYGLEALTAAIRESVVGRAHETAPGTDHPALAELIGESPAIKAVKTLIVKFAASDRPVLLTGESGTGKELAARAVHRASRRATGRFVSENCGAIPAPLLESELFGTEKGAFTDAVPRAGSFERADGGTLFLDEVGELPLEAQVKLLRALESGTVNRVGGAQERQVDLRIVSATNADLSIAIERGRFRSDLFYRISTLPIRLPPLRERTDDIPALARHLLDAAEPRKRLSAAALERLMEHSWPGNVRELRNVIDRAALLADGDAVEPRHLFFNLSCG